MKSKFLLLSITIAVLSSCSTSYKTGQTPDDVYYSPARPQDNYARRDNDPDSYRDRNAYDNSVYTSPEDLEIRRRIHSRRYRRYNDRYNYPYDTYNYPYDYPYGYGYNGYPVYVYPKVGTKQNLSQPRKYNLGAYTPNTATETYPQTGKPVLSGSATAPVRTFQTPPNNGSGVGNLIRKIFSTDNSSPSNNGYNPGTSNNSSPFRTFDSRGNSSNSSSGNNNSNSNNSTSGSKGSSAPVRTFKNDN